MSLGYSAAIDKWLLKNFCWCCVGRSWSHGQNQQTELDIVDYGMQKGGARPSCLVALTKKGRSCAQKRQHSKRKSVYQSLQKQLALLWKLNCHIWMRYWIITALFVLKFYDYMTLMKLMIKLIAIMLIYEGNHNLWWQQACRGGGLTGLRPLLRIFVGLSHPLSNIR